MEGFALINEVVVILGSAISESCSYRSRLPPLVFEDTLKMLSFIQVRGQSLRTTQPQKHSIKCNHCAQICTAEYTAEVWFPAPFKQTVPVLVHLPFFLRQPQLLSHCSSTSSTCQLYAIILSGPSLQNILPLFRQLLVLAIFALVIVDVVV